MRVLLVGIVVSVMIAPLSAGDPPLVEKYLHSGELTKGEQALELALAKNPQDDQLRLSLGVLQVVRGVERLGQTLHEHGVKPGVEWMPFIRLPVPHNPAPSPIHYQKFRRMIDDFSRDLLNAETTLAGITDDQVQLPLRLAAIHLDLDADGSATDRFQDILTKMMGRTPDHMGKNPDFKVVFDRGDVAWLRAYCHLLAGLADLYLAFESEPYFQLYGEQLFSKVKPHLNDDERRALQKKYQEFQTGFTLYVREPARLSRFRVHMLQVCKLNRETWRFIRAEKDDDHEWLPNPRQKGAMGLPVQDGMIDAWLGMVQEMESLLEGKKVIPMFWRGGDPERGINVKTVLDEPPAKFDFLALLNDGPSAKYISKGTEVDGQVIWRAFQMFDRPMMMGYMAWFN